ncbi:MAG: VOC family protein [Rhodospirillaceae bacterium]|nr:MAG: VOC family protein [Rhodospirillaceae bacterium]
MIDHASVPVRSLLQSADTYERFLKPLGYTRLVERAATIGFGKKYPELWLNARPKMIMASDDAGYHVCLRAPDEKAVCDFHATALEAGCQCAGPPGNRQGAMALYFAAFIFDKDGNKIEAATFSKDCV